MLSKKTTFRAIVILVLALPFVLIAQEISNETIIAEYDGGKITKGELEERIEKIPAMYRQKYSTNEGKVDLLNMLGTEAIFYQEALSMGLENDEEVLQRIDLQFKSAFYNEYKQDLINQYIQKETKKEYEKRLAEQDEITYDSYVVKAGDNLRKIAGLDSIYNDASKWKIIFESNSDKLESPGLLKIGQVLSIPRAKEAVEIKFEEVKFDVRNTITPEQQREMIEKKKQELFAKYNIKIINSILDSVKIEEVIEQKYPENEKFILSSNPDLEKYLADFLELNVKIAPQKIQRLQDAEDLKRMVEQSVEYDVFYLDALEKGLDKKESLKEMSEQIKLNMILRTTYNRLVVEIIPTADEDLKKYYDENIKKFSTKPYRKIQAFVFETEKQAKNMRKKVKKALKKNDEETIAGIIENSAFPQKEGIIDHIYNNDIVPSFGKDKEFCKAIWDADPKKLSKISQNSKEEFLFFKILKDSLAVATPFDEVKGDIKTTMVKEISRENFENLKKELEAKYNLKKYPDRLLVKLTVEEYFNKSEESQKKRRFKDAIYYYDQIIKFYPNNVDDYKAMFMKGFLYAEELNEKEKAIEMFNELLEKYPEGDLTESARFMVEELSGKTQVFEEIEGNK